MIPRASSLFNRQLVLSCLAVATFGLAIAGVMYFFKYASSVGSTQQARMRFIASELGDVIEKGAAVGVSLTDSPRLAETTKRRLDVDPLVRGIEITDAEGRLVLQATRPQGHGTAPRTVAITARNSFDLALGTVTLTYDGEPLQRQRQEFASSLLLASAILIPLCGLLAALGSVRFGFSLARAMSVFWLAAGIIALGAIAHARWQNDLAPEFFASAQTVSRSAATLFSRAADLELPLQDLPGVEQYFAKQRANHPEFAAFVVSVGEKTVHHIGIVPDGASIATAPIQRAGIGANNGTAALTTGANEGSAPTSTIGELRIAIDPAATSRLFREMALDLVTIIIIAGFLAGELFRYLLRDSTGDEKAASATARELASLRAPAFLVFLAEDLSRSFMPVFASHLPPSPIMETLGISLAPRLLGGLPVTAFMLAVALAQPLVGDLSRRYGARHVLIGAALTAAAAHALAALCEHIDTLLLVRIVAALAWAVAFSAVQGAVLEKEGRQHRARGMAYFVGIIMTASICGPATGGILADSLGQRSTLVISAVVALLALLPLFKAPRDVVSPLAHTVNASSTGALLGNRNFLHLVVLAAIPAKLILIGYCFYLIPMFVDQWGGTAADAGRLQMLYSIVMVAAVPWFARSARPDGHAYRVAGGLVVSGLSGFLLLWPSLYTAAAMVLILGLGQAMSIAAQGAMVGDICNEEVAACGDGPVYGVYRMLERGGNALGPVVAATLVGLAGVTGAFAIIGSGVALGGLVFGGRFGVLRRRKKAP